MRGRRLGRISWKKEKHAEKGRNEDKKKRKMKRIKKNWKQKGRTEERQNN